MTTFDLPLVYVTGTLDEHFTEIANELLYSGDCVPYVPKLTTFWFNDPAVTVAYDTAMLMRCNVVLALAKNPYVELSAAERGTPVFMNVRTTLAHCRDLRMCWRRQHDEPASYAYVPDPDVECIDAFDNKKRKRRRKR